MDLRSKALFPQCNQYTLVHLQVWKQGQIWERGFNDRAKLLQR